MLHSSIVQCVKVQRVIWLEHVGRMSDHRHTKRLLVEAEGGKNENSKTEEEMVRRGDDKIEDSDTKYILLVKSISHGP